MKQKLWWLPMIRGIVALIIGVLILCLAPIFARPIYQFSGDVLGD